MNPATHTHNFHCRTWPSYLDDLEAEVALVQHYDLVLVRAVVNHVSQREQCVAAGQHRLTPGGVTLVADDQAAAVACDGFIQGGRLLGLLQAGEVVLKGQERSDVALWDLTRISGTCAQQDNGGKNPHIFDLRK